MMKCIVTEAGEVSALLGQARPGEAAHYLRRMAAMLSNLAPHIAVLETMTPADYHVIRLTALGNGSGQESPGFNQILGLGAPLWSAFEAERARVGVSLEQLFREPRAHWDFWLLTQAYLTLDEAFQAWRFAHFVLVKRIIGIDVKSLKDIPAKQLARGMQETFFPELWEHVNVLTRETRPGH
jgi:tryptophan 2,3-dioxygenase